LNKIYTVNFYDQSLSVIDGATDSVVTTVYAGYRPHAIDFNPATNLIYTSSGLSNNIHIIDGTSYSMIDSIQPLVPSIGEIAINPSTNHIYTLDVWNNVVGITDATSGSFINYIPVGVAPYGIDINPLTNSVYVTNCVGNDVSVIDDIADSVVATINVGIGPRGVCIDPEINHIYVANSTGNSISTINGATDSVIATCEVGSRAWGIGVNPRTNKVYVSCIYDGTVWVLHDEEAGVEEFTLNPEALSLNINPNPFNKTTQFVLSIPADSKGKSVEFSIYNVNGRMVKTFSHISISNYSNPVSFTWDGKGNSGNNLNSGIYFGILKVGENKVSKKIITIK